jgi:RNA polymerase sigma factor (sigma-70 family)
MSRLSEAQQALVIDHIPNARAWAAESTIPIPYDDRLSIAYEALCDLALAMPANYSYSTLAKMKVRQAICDYGRWQRNWHRRHAWLAGVATLDDISIESVEREAEIRDLARLFSGRFSRLTKDARKIMRLTVKGYSRAEIAKRLGVSESTVKSAKQRAVIKLLAR